MRMATRKISAFYDEGLAPSGINVAQYGLLRRIAAKNMSLTELGASAGLDRSTIGRNVRVLERMKLVKSARGKDQREAVVSLTEAGTATLAAATPLWQACQKKVEERLGPEKLEVLREALEAL
ncbi:MarR family winged helix-turn-helix transcriptional regulator [Xanthobacter pseudotagetidis]|uniref:MarR family winged helix-turn-helix transcriptional regulator n=1 Tax=Xanthobacter pseudotagetidis TaxID=3119911 RepID=UPI003727F6CE